MTIRLSATVAALLLSMTACNSTHDAKPRPQTGSVAGPNRFEAGVPVGYPPTSAGARAAAARYVAVLGGVLGLDPSRRDLALSAVSRYGRPPVAITARWVTRPNVERATGVQEALRSGEPLIAAAVPIMSRVTAYDGGNATVTVWATAVLGTKRFGSLEQSWATETVTLQWFGDWKLTAYESAPGPVPALSQPVTPVVAALASTAGMSGVFDGPS